MWKKIKKWLKHVLSIPEVDWHLVWVIDAHWTNGIRNQITDRAYYKIYYSTYLRQFKLECEGYKWTEHSMYIKALEALKNFEINLLKTNKQWV